MRSLASPLLLPVLLGLSACPPAETHRAPRVLASPTFVQDPPVAGVELERVAVIGASVSKGFGSGIQLATVLEYALHVPHSPVRDFSNGRQFLDSVDVGAGEIDKCIEARATLVVGIDFLFWYAYGLPYHGASELERRRAILDQGLAELERLECPLVIGDIPDLHDATSVRLAAIRIPTPPVLDALNAHIADWASRRPNTLVAPLREWVRVLKAGEWKIAGSADGRAPETPIRADQAIGPDRIHPTALGTLLLGDRVVDLVRAHYALAPDELGFEFWKTAAKLPVAVPRR